MNRKRVAGVMVWAMALWLASPAAGQKDAKPEKDSGLTRVRIEIVAGEKDQPVDSASVYVKYQQERVILKDKKHEMNLKSNKDGVVRVPPLPRGKVLVQVIAQGWKTFGQWYELNQEEQTIRIKLQKPPRWY